MSVSPANSTTCWCFLSSSLPLCYLSLPLHHPSSSMIFLGLFVDVCSPCFVLEFDGPVLSIYQQSCKNQHRYLITWFVSNLTMSTAANSLFLMRKLELQLHATTKQQFGSTKLGGISIFRLHKSNRSLQIDKHICFQALKMMRYQYPWEKQIEKVLFLVGCFFIILVNKFFVFAMASTQKVWEPCGMLSVSIHKNKGLLYYENKTSNIQNKCTTICFVYFGWETLKDDGKFITTLDLIGIASDFLIFFFFSQSY